MSEVVNTTERLLANHEAVKSTVPADALSSLRALAMQSVEMSGLPGNANENWKYFGTRDILGTEYVHGADAPEVAFQGVQQFDLDCDRIVFVNGRLDTKLSNTIDDYTLLPLAEALESRPDDVKAAIASDYSVDEIARNNFAALNTAVMQHGLFIDVEKNREAKRPLHVIFMSVPGESPAQSHPRLVVNLGENSRLSLIESHVGTGDAANFCNIATDINIARGARLEHTRLIEGMTDDRQVANIRVNVARDADYTNHNMSLGHRQLRTDLRVSLNEPGAHTELNGLFVTSGNQHMDNHLLVEHLAERTTSNQVYRGVADDRGRGVFNGKVYVAKDAQKIEAHQASNNLLLAKLAEIDTKPELEIYADDVKCSHGATIGQLDDNMLFYLQSRGIDADTARALLIFAFVDEIVHRLPFPSVRAHLEAHLVGRLPDTDIVRNFLGTDTE
ncbi:MAG: Fe-S cluster assembly protein SufD [Gammaproteobacteria bacterium]|nr:Fe-S cluster assembly protein SufD [Gammaproteobacteria bacterium]